MEQIVLLLGFCVILCASSEIDVNLSPEISDENTTIADVTNSTLKDLVEEIKVTSTSPQPPPTTTHAANDQELLIPPATVNANIAQMHHSNAPKKKGPIVIR